MATQAATHHSPITRIGARSLFRADAVFELGLGSVLTAAGAFGWLSASDIPVSRGVVIGAGAAFLAGGASVLGYFVRAHRRVLLELAVGNAALACAGLVWLVADRGFSGLGVAIVSVFIGWKTAISGLQLAALRAADHRSSGSPS
jgi:hypothetical protein